ncbi:MAG TPA: patatin-like phospholipase family protein [Acholeplasmataceae bacterium]|nr:patatin-like phospholipase family protein [Acholeplasmataceae bacterium]
MNVVFQGGGIKGLAYVGALKYLEERGLHIKKCAGTSIGAIMAALVCAGYKSYELVEILNNLDIDMLWPKKKNIIDKTISTVKQKSLYTLDVLERFLHSLFSKKGVTKFSDLKVGNDYQVKMITTFLKEKKLIVIPNDLKYFGINPDTFPLAKGACMSSALPLVYSPYKLNEYKFIDGGVIDNFPIWLFDEALGFKLSKESDIINYAQRKIFKAPKKKEKNIILIDTSKYKATDFRKGYEERYYLFNSGYYHTKVFFDNYFRKRLEI